MNTSFVLHGDLCFTESPQRMTTIPGGWLICDNGVCVGAFNALPERYADWPVEDYAGKLIFPGLCDLHIHAPQFAYRGLGMDMELIDWLNQNAFPEETRYADEAYALRAYRQFAAAMRRSATTRACVFATRHVPATLLLAELLERAGLRGFVGKVNMDRNAPAPLCEVSAEQSLADTEAWLEQAEQHTRIRPVLTPRFIPSCTDALMRGLRALQSKRGLPLQSHLSENVSEISWVRKLCPYADYYADAYDRFCVLGKKTVMAHVVHPTKEEIELLAERRVMVAHCPASNTNLASGVSPVRKLLASSVRVGLGSDVAGGQTPDLFRAMTDAVQTSKLYWRLVDQSVRPLTLSEAFYLATKGGGAYFGKVGSFEKGYELDAVVIDDSAVVCPRELTVLQRAERAIYLSGECAVTRKYVCGEAVNPHEEEAL